MRASRLLSILMLLQTRSRMSASALAKELDVSTRTILRDLDQLTIAGVPVWAERGRDGGFQLSEGWSTTLTGLTEAEAHALFLAGLPAAATELGLGGASTSARLKLLAAVPASFRDDAARASARLHVDPVDWYRTVVPPKYLQAVANAVWRQRVLSMRYESWTSVRERQVKPLGLVLKAGNWYLVAMLEDGKTPRTYRLSSIQHLVVRETVFRYPKRFDLTHYWLESTRRFEMEIYTGTATLRATARGIKLLKEFSAAVSEAVTQSAVIDIADVAWSQVVIPIESVEHATGQLLGLGVEVQVLEPSVLRERMRAIIVDMAALYRSPRKGRPKRSRAIQRPSSGRS